MVRGERSKWLLSLVIFGVLVASFSLHFYESEAQTQGSPSTTGTTDKTVLAAYWVPYQTKAMSGSWRGWEWDAGVYHNPERILSDGRRDIASCYYPLIGPYDSSDNDVIHYHIGLAKSIGIDGFVVDWWMPNFGGTHGEVSFRSIDHRRPCLLGTFLSCPLSTFKIDNQM
jgi:hypothetical protein